MSELVIDTATVVGFHYDLYDGDARRIESSRDGEPVRFLFGDRSVLAALQAAFRGKRAGEDFSVTIPHGQAYGRRYPERTRRVSVKDLPGGRGARPRPGQVVDVPGDPDEAGGQGRRVPATVIKVGRFQVDVDLNHPLAGTDLTFDVTIDSVRAAEAIEIEHGHVHGPGGHAH